MSRVYVIYKTAVTESAVRTTGRDRYRTLKVEGDKTWREKEVGDINGNVCESGDEKG